MPQTQLYTQEQLDIAVLKTGQEGIFRDFSRFHSELSSLKEEVKNDFNEMYKEMKSHNQWNIGLILGIYGMIAATALGKVFGIL